MWIILQDGIMCIEYDQCKDLLVRPRIIEDNCVDPFEIIPGNEVCQKSTPRFTIDPDNVFEDEGIIND